MVKVSGPTKTDINELFYNLSTAKHLDDLWDHFVNFNVHFGARHTRTCVFELHAPIIPESILDDRSFPSGPGSWSQYYMDNALYEHDHSFLSVFEKQLEVLEWQDTEMETRRGTESSRVFDERRNFGMGNGFLITKASHVHGYKILSGFGGATRTIQALKNEHFEALVQCWHVFNNRYLQLGSEQGVFAAPTEPSVIRFSDREREIIKALSLGQKVSEIAAKLNRTEALVHTTISRAKKKAQVSTREGLIGLAFRSYQVD
ncbi:MAG: autoinducer binding domain-containing protein [Flavobacteriaceae bacterium]